MVKKRGTGGNSPLGFLSQFQATLRTRVVDNYESTAGKLFEGSMFLLNMFAITLFAIDTYPLSEENRILLHTTEVVVVSFFVVEYALRMWVAEHKIRHFFSVYSIIDLASILPILVSLSDLGFFRVVRILRAVRVIRVLRVARVLRFQRAFKSKSTLFGGVSDTDLIVIRIALTVFTIIFISAGLTWAIEGPVSPDKIRHIWDAMYFTIITITTVGYGDISPVTTLGRIVSVLTVLAGVTLIPWQLGKLVKLLFVSSTKVGARCPKCGLAEHDPDAVRCKLCGATLEKKKGPVTEEQQD